MARQLAGLLPEFLKTKPAVSNERKPYMAKTFTPAQIRKGLSEVAQLITDPRLPTALSSIASDAKLFAKAKAKPKAFLAKHHVSLAAALTQLRLARELTRVGTKITLCIHTRYEIGSGGGVFDENGNYYPAEGVIEGEVCTTFVIPK